MVFEFFNIFLLGFIAAVLYSISITLNKIHINNESKCEIIPEKQGSVEEITQDEFNKLVSKRS